MGLSNWYYTAPIFTYYCIKPITKLNIMMHHRCYLFIVIAYNIFLRHRRYPKRL